MKEYTTEKGKEVNLNSLRAPLMSPEDYKIAHSHLVLACHDIIINYQGEALLIIRKIAPAKDVLWPIGGRIEKGMPIEESLRRRVQEECNLTLANIVDLGHARAFWNTDPFGHGKGSDALSIMYTAIGFGELKLDDSHRDPYLLSPEGYTHEFRKQLQPYVQDFLDLAIPYIKRGGN